MKNLQPCGINQGLETHFLLCEEFTAMGDLRDGDENCDKRDLCLVQYRMLAVKPFIAHTSPGPMVQGPSLQTHLHS